MGWQWGGSNLSQGGCNPSTCTFNPGWVCQQPGSPASIYSLGLPDIPGPVPIPGPGDTVLIGQGWGEVPRSQNLSCWCIAPAGWYASPQLNCVALPCPFPARCVEKAFQPGNGTECVTGSDGAQCSRCSRRWYRLGADCLPCPSGVSPALILLCIFLGAAFLYIAPKLAQLASPKALGYIKGLVQYLTNLDISFSISLKWPPALLSAFKWLKSLTSGLQLAAPECLSGNWNFYVEVQLILVGCGVLYALVLFWSELSRLSIRLIRMNPDRSDTGHWLGFIPSSNHALLEYHDALVARRNQMKQVAGFMTAITYIYVCNALLKAWDCVNTAEGMVLKSDTSTSCTSAKMLSFRKLAAGLLVAVGVGVPLGTAAWLRHLRRRTKRDSALTRKAWFGLGDPVTRFGWGAFYEVYRFRNLRDATQAETPDSNAELYRFLSPSTARWFRLRARFDRARHPLSVRFAPYFETMVYVEKLCLLIASHLLAKSVQQTILQVLVYCTMSLVILVLWPCQRLDVSIPARAWLPSLPRGWALAEKGSASGWRKASCGWLWSGTVALSDSLNWTTFLANAVPAVNIILVALANGRGDGVLQVFLVGLNVLQILAMCTIWLYSVVKWRLQGRELLTVRAAAAEKHKGDVSDGEEAAVEVQTSGVASLDDAHEGDSDAELAAEDKRYQSFSRTARLGALVAALSGMAKASLTLNRDFDEVVATTARAGKKRLALLKRGRLTEAAALDDMVDTLLKTTLAQLEQRRRFLMHHTESTELVVVLADQITHLEAMFKSLGFEREHFERPLAMERQRLDAAMMAMEVSQAPGSGTRAAPVPGWRVVLGMLVVLLGISLGVGLAAKSLFVVRPPLLPEAVIYTSVPVVSLRNLTLTGDLNATALSALLAGLPGMGAIAGVSVGDYPVSTTLTLAGPTAPLSDFAQLALCDALASALSLDSTLHVTVAGGSLVACRRRLLDGGCWMAA